MLYTGALSSTLPWLIAELKDTQEVMGKDYWPYGIAKNRVEIDKLESYMYSQGLCSKKLSVEELFAEETLDT